MSKFMKGLAVAALVVAGAGRADAQVLNGGFEAGDFTGFATLGEVQVVGNFGGLAPPSGSFQAAVGTGDVGNAIAGVAVTPAQLEAFLGLTAGTLNNLGQGVVINFGAVGSAIRQTVTVNAGDVLSFNFNFLTNENTPSSFNDFAFVSIVPPAGNAVVLANTNFNGGNFLPAPAATGFAEQTGFQTLTFTFTSGGTFTLGIGVVDGQDNTVDSAVLVDNISITAVPEPGTLALAGLGLVGLAGYGWRRCRDARMG